MVPAISYVANFIGTFQEYPQRQKVGSFVLGDLLKKMTPKTN